MPPRRRVAPRDPPSMPCQAFTGREGDGRQCKRRTKWLNTSHKCALEPKCWQHLERDHGLKVMESTVPRAGRGLFAVKDFERNELVNEYAGPLLPEEDELDDDHYRFKPRGSPFVITSEDPSLSTVTRFINCPRGTGRPTNVRFMDRFVEPCVRNTRRSPPFGAVNIRTTRRIRASKTDPTELLVGYGPGYWDAEGN